MESKGDDSPRPATPEELTHARKLIRELLARRRASEDIDPDQLILDNPSLAGVLEQQLQSLRAAWSIETGPHGSLGGPPAFLSRTQPGSRYEINDVIGSGAFSVVYRAFDRLLQRQIALKVLRPRAAGATLAHALREGRASARLTHPNIVPVHDLGTADGCVYLAMDLIEGETLAAYLERHKDRPPFRISAQFVRQLAQALDYAHSSGIVHRDVKPANVLIDERGVPRLTDFGLARTLEDSAEVAERKEITGSPAYMAPEQAAGRSEEADGRADVYGLGVVMYEMLAGRRPFEGRDMAELLRRVREESPAAPRRLVPAVPIDLELICLKALEKKPEDRFATAGAMETELGRWLNGDPPGLRRQTLRERVRRWVRDNQVRTTAGVMVSLLLLVVAGGLVFHWFERLRDKEHQDALRNATVLVKDARLRLRSPVWGRVAAAQDALREALRETAKLPPGEQRARLELDIRSAFVASLGVPDQKPDRPADFGGLPGIFSRSWPVALHPSGRRMAVGLVKRQGGEVPMVWERGKPWPWPEARRGELNPDQERPRLAYSPDGRFLIFLPTTGEVQLWDGLAERRLAVRQAKEPQPVVAVGFAPDGSRLWCCNAVGRVFALGLPNLREEATWSVRTEGTLTAAAFNHDATRLAVGDAAGTVRLYPSDSTQTALAAVSAVLGGTNFPFHALPHFGRLPVSTGPLTDRDGFEVTALAWSQDGSRLAVASMAETVHLWAVESGERLWSANSFGEVVRSLQFHPTKGWLFGGTSSERGRSSRRWQRTGSGRTKSCWGQRGRRRSCRRTNSRPCPRKGASRWRRCSAMRSVRSSTASQWPTAPSSSAPAPTCSACGRPAEGRAPGGLATLFPAVRIRRSVFATSSVRGDLTRLTWCRRHIAQWPLRTRWMGSEEDGVTMARNLAANPDPARALEAFTRERYDRTAAITEESWRLGKLGQGEGWVSCWLRDRVMSLLLPAFGARTFAKHASFDVGPLR